MDYPNITERLLDFKLTMKSFGSTQRGIIIPTKNTSSEASSFAA
jgi:hypothetical protein